MDTLLSIFPLVILKTRNAQEIFESAPYQLLKLLRKIAYLLGKKSLSKNEMDDIQQYWELAFNLRLKLTDQENPATVVKKPKPTGNQPGNSQRATNHSLLESSQQSQQEPYPSQASPLLFGDSLDQGEQDGELVAPDEHIAIGDQGADDDDREGDNDQGQGQSSTREKYFPALIPKEHYFLHISCQIKNFGPASRSLSTQSYEQKHQGHSQIYISNGILT